MTPFFKVLSMSLAALTLLVFSLHLACAADSVTGAESRSPEDQPISLDQVARIPIGDKRIVYLRDDFAHFPGKKRHGARQNQPGCQLEESSRFMPRVRVVGLYVRG